MGELTFTTTDHGVRICSESFGDRDGTPLVLLHGAGNSMVYWDSELVNALVAKGFHVIRVDARDAGRSTSSPLGAPDYSLPDLARDIATVIRAGGIGRAVIAGVSQGASIAQLLALDHAEQVSALCLISTTPGIPGEEAGDLSPLFGTMDVSTAGTPSAPPPWGDTEALVTHLVDTERRYGGTAFDEELAERDAREDVELTIDLPAQLTNPFLVGSGQPWRARLGLIDVPVLVVHGSQDPIFPPDHGRALAAEIPGAELVVLDGVGHANIPPVHWPELVAGIASLRER